MLRGDLEGGGGEWEGDPRGGDICVYRADLLLLL